MTQHLLRLGIGCSQVDSQVEFVSLKILKQSATVQHARDYSGIDWATLEKCIEFMFQEYKTNSEGLRQELAGFAVKKHELLENSSKSDIHGSETRLNSINIWIADKENEIGKLYTTIQSTLGYVENGLTTMQFEKQQGAATITTTVNTTTDITKSKVYS